MRGCKRCGTDISHRVRPGRGRRPDYCGAACKKREQRRVKRESENATEQPMAPWTRGLTEAEVARVEGGFERQARSLSEIEGLIESKPGEVEPQRRGAFEREFFKEHPARPKDALRTRLVGDPRPEFAPRVEDFELEDGKPQYKCRPLVKREREWLDRVAPRTVRPVKFERASDWVPACHAGDPDRVDHTPGPLDIDIYGIAIAEPAEVVSLDELRGRECDELEQAA